MKNLKKINQKSLFFLAGVLVVVAVLVSLNLSGKVFGATGGGGGGAGDGGIGDGAGPTCTLTGFAWSGYENRSGMGWIGFGPQNNFRVDVDSNGLLNGYAWIGDNTAEGSIGWVKFGGLSDSDFPGQGGNAKLDWESGELSGWARVCSAAPNPQNCSGQGSHSNAGGWDGWISLSGTANNGSSYGVKWNSDTQRFEGYAWGGEEVAGWISFSGVNYAVTFTTNACKSLVGGGGGGFDYQVSIDPITISSSDDGNIQNYPVMITMVSGSSPEEVQFKDSFPLHFDDGVDKVTVNLGDITSCTPPLGGTCNPTLTLNIEYKTGSGNLRAIPTQNIPTESNSISRPGGLDINIRESGAVSCSPNPTFAPVGQEVTWTADPGNLEDVVKFYDWSGDNLEETTIEPERSVKVEYNSVGRKNASVNVRYNCTEDGDGNEFCETKSAQCSPSVQVFSDILFEHL